MVKKRTVFQQVILIMSMSLFFFLSDSACNEAPTIPISLHTTNVLRRYYFIARLERIIMLINKIYNVVDSKKGQKFDFHENNYTFHHPIIQRSIDLIEQTKTLKPLFMVWDEFISYKYLADDVFLEDFSKEIFIITKATTHTIAQSKSLSLYHLPPHICGLSILEKIEYYADILISMLCETKHSSLRINKDEKLLSYQASTEDIMVRFYQIERLKPIMAKLEQHKRLYPHRSHKEMEILISLWNDFKLYKFVDNYPMVKTFIGMVFVVSKILISSEHDDSFDDESEKLNIEELLTAIDATYDYIVELQQQYEQSKETSWLSWAKHNWQAILASFGSYALQTFYHYHSKNT